MYGLKPAYLVMTPVAETVKVALVEKFYVSKAWGFFSTQALQVFEIDKKYELFQMTAFPTISNISDGRTVNI